MPPTIAIARTGTPTEPLAKPLSMDGDRVVIEIDNPAKLAEVFDVIGRIIRKRGRIVILDE